MTPMSPNTGSGLEPERLNPGVLHTGHTGPVLPESFASNAATRASRSSIFWGRAVSRFHSGMRSRSALSSSSKAMPVSGVELVGWYRQAYTGGRSYLEQHGGHFARAGFDIEVAQRAEGKTERGGDVHGAHAVRLKVCDA